MIRIGGFEGGTMFCLLQDYIKRNIPYFRLFLVISLLAGCARGSQMSPFFAPGAGPTSVIANPPYMMPRDIYHEVGPQETLWRISKTYGVDAETLLQVNHLNNPNQLKNGQKLLIPGTLGPRAVVPLYPNRRWTYIVIHHTASDFGNARTIDNMHHDRGFWNGLGYHFLIDNGTVEKFDGQIEVGPRWVKQEVGAHTKASNMNERGIGISLVGNFSEDLPSENQMASLVFLVKTLQNYYRIPARNVVGHRDVPGANTECPGTRFPWNEFKQKLAA